MSVVWNEISPDTRGWTLAGRRSTPPGGRATTDPIQFLWRHWANYTVNRAIREQLRGWRSQADAALYHAQRNHGLLAVATTEEIRYDAQRVEANVAVTVYTEHVFASPVAARRWWESMSRSPRGTICQGTASPVGSQIRRRFLWGTYQLPAMTEAPPAVPRPENRSMRGRVGSRRHIVRQR
jgi:hypothetical protein